MATDVSYVRHEQEVTKSGVCSVSGKPYQVTVLYKRLLEWLSGIPPAEAFPDLDDDQRDFIVTGWTPAEQVRRLAEKKD